MVLMARMIRSQTNWRPAEVAIEPRGLGLLDRLTGADQRADVHFKFFRTVGTAESGSHVGVRLGTKQIWSSVRAFSSCSVLVPLGGLTLLLGCVTGR